MRKDVPFPPDPVVRAHRSRLREGTGIPLRPGDGRPPRGALGPARDALPAAGGAGCGALPPVCSSRVAAAHEKPLPPEVSAAAVFRLAVGEEIDRDDLSRRLAELGYARLPATSDPGDFSLRGGIGGVYSPAHAPRA